MPIFNVKPKMSRELVELPNRFVQGGFCKMGAAKHEPRTSTAQEIADSLMIKLKNWEARCKKPEEGLVYCAKICGVDLEKEAKKNGVDLFEAARNLGRRTVLDEQGNHTNRVIDFVEESQNAKIRKTIYEHNLQGLKEFTGNMDNMPARHLSVAHDIIDVDSIYSFINHNIFPTANWQFLGKQTGSDTDTGRDISFLQCVFENLPNISKRYPAVLNLFDKIMSNSDEANIKYFFAKFFSKVPDITAPVENIEAAEASVPVLAESLLSGMPSMDLYSTCKENKFFESIAAFFTHDSKPENAKLIPQILEMANAQGIKNIDIAGFLARNVNLD